MITTKTTSENHAVDINFHLDLMVTDCYRLQFDQNRNAELQHFCEKMQSNISFIKELIYQTQIPLANSIISTVNGLYKADPNLSNVILHIVNSKRDCNPDATAFLKIEA